MKIRLSILSAGFNLTQTNGDNMNTLNEKEARQIAEDTKQFDESVSKIMNLAVTLRQERDKARSDRDLFADWYRKYKTDLENVLAVGTVEEKEANEYLVKNGRLHQTIADQDKDIVELERQRDEALGKQPLFEKNQAEASELKAEDLKPALILALCQRDVALRSVRKIHKICDLIKTWDGNTPENWNNGPRADHIVGHIKDVILIKEDV